MVLDIGIEVLNLIEEDGYKAYLVGGFVRDYLLGLEINDLDITTNMPIDLLKKKFNVLDNGSKYLSVTIVYKDYSFEITNFRKDLGYTDHRHPNVLVTDSIEEDSLRRDFTINALYMDKNGQIFDFHNGKQDLALKQLKMIGNPFFRFEEDALRILRGLYFSSKLGFEIESNTLFAMVDKKELLGSLKEDVLYKYFIKILYEKNDQAIRYINELDLFQYIPKFKRWLNLVNRDIKEEDLIYYYYLKTKDFPITVSNTVKEKAKVLEVLLKNQEPYTLYQNKVLYFAFRDILKHNGCDIIRADERVASFIINNDKELAISKEEIASYYKGKEKSIHIEMVKKAILNGEIKNTREDILDYLGGQKNV